MVEDVFLQDLRKRGVEVLRNSPFTDFDYSEGDKGKQDLMVHYKDLISNTRKTLNSEYLVGCDGAHSTVRKSMPFAVMDGESGGSTWGVLDGKLGHLICVSFLIQSQASSKQISQICGARPLLVLKRLGVFFVFPERGT
jgi:2-polyprenyl-6-methoxyphenol hydroxylase-like FAD-dependent oxidoreductase